jgi:ATP-dependent protease Clp ATPase subunit
MKKLSDIPSNQEFYALINLEVLDKYDDGNVWKKFFKDNLNKKRNCIAIPVSINKRYILEVIQDVDKNKTILFKDFHFDLEDLIGFTDSDGQDIDPNLWHIINQRLSIVKKSIEKRVFGQNQAKDALISSLICMELNNFFGKTKKSCLLISGPSGSGKTELLRSVPNFLYNVQVFDCSNLTAAGYKGTNVDDLVRLIKSEKEKHPKHPLIIFLDEFDKVAVDKSDNSTKNLLQANLLKIIEGTNYKLPANQAGNQTTQSIDTGDVLFVCAGAFSSLNKEKLSTSDLIDYGILPELVGRMTHITNTTKLDRATLKNIFLNAETSSFVRMKNRLNLFNVNLELSDCFLEYSLDVAEKSPLGARVLEQMVQEYINPYWVQLSSFIGKTIVIEIKGEQVLSAKEPNPLLED